MEHDEHEQVLRPRVARVSAAVAVERIDKTLGTLPKLKKHFANLREWNPMAASALRICLILAQEADLVEHANYTIRAALALRLCKEASAWLTNWYEDNTETVADDMGSWLVCLQELVEEFTPSPQILLWKVQPGLMVPVRNQVQRPFEMVAMDLAGPLPTTRKGNRYFLLIVDIFSGWLELIPLTNIKATTVLAAFRKQWCDRYGIPSALITDRGAQFTGQEATRLFEELGIDKRTTTLPSASRWRC